MSNIPYCSNGRTRHEWSNDWNLVGGIKENPGVWGIGGAAISIKEACPHCGATRSKVVGDVDHPSRNHGWRYDSGYDSEYDSE